MVSRFYWFILDIEHFGLEHRSDVLFDFKVVILLWYFLVSLLHPIKIIFLEIIVIVGFCGAVVVILINLVKLEIIVGSWLVTWVEIVDLSWLEIIEISIVVIVERKIFI